MKHLILVLLLLVPFCAQGEEESGLYAFAGAGAMTIKDINNSKIADNPRFTSNAGSVKNKTTYESFGLGYCFNEYFCAEGAYITGAEFNTTLDVQSVNAGAFDFAGARINVGTLPAKFTVVREAKMTSGQLSVLGKLPVNDWIDVFGRVGVYEYKINTVEKILFPQNLYLAEEGVEKGRIPMASLGLDVKPIKKLNVRFEGTKTGKVTVGWVGLVYKF